MSLDAGEQAGDWWWIRLGSGGGSAWSLVVDQAGAWWWIRLGSVGGSGWGLVVDEERIRPVGRIRPVDYFPWLQSVL